jgi:hypothetical protein
VWRGMLSFPSPQLWVTSSQRIWPMCLTYWEGDVKFFYLPLLLIAASLPRKCPFFCWGQEIAVPSSLGNPGPVWFRRGHLTTIDSYQNITLGAEVITLTERLPSMCKALGSIPCPEKR